MFVDHCYKGFVESRIGYLPRENRKFRMDTKLSSRYSIFGKLQKTWAAICMSYAIFLLYGGSFSKDVKFYGFCIVLCL